MINTIKDIENILYESISKRDSIRKNLSKELNRFLDRFYEHNEQYLNSLYDDYINKKDEAKLLNLLEHALDKEESLFYHGVEEGVIEIWRAPFVFSEENLRRYHYNMFDSSDNPPLYISVLNSCEGETTMRKIIVPEKDIMKEYDNLDSKVSETKMELFYEKIKLLAGEDFEGVYYCPAHAPLNVNRIGNWTYSDNYNKTGQENPCPTVFPPETTRGFVYIDLRDRKLPPEIEPLGYDVVYFTMDWPEDKSTYHVMDMTLKKGGYLVTFPGSLENMPDEMKHRFEKIYEIPEWVTISKKLG